MQPYVTSPATIRLTHSLKVSKGGVELSQIPYFITYNPQANSLVASIYTISTADVGAYTLQWTAKITDLTDATPTSTSAYTTVLNITPYMIVTPSDQSFIYVAANFVKFFQIPSFVSSPVGETNYTFTCQQLVGGVLTNTMPTFISFDANLLQFRVYTNTNKDFGLKTFKIIAKSVKDQSILSSSLTVAVDVQKNLVPLYSI